MDGSSLKSVQSAWHVDIWNEKELSPGRDPVVLEQIYIFG